MDTLHVVNIKCGGCAKSITSALEKEGSSHVSVNNEQQTVSFEGESETARKILSSLGYPEAGSEEAKSLLKKAQSYASCAIGKMKK